MDFSNSSEDSSGASISSLRTVSPFDEAASRPLLGEPTKKKWSLFSGKKARVDEPSSSFLSTRYRTPTHEIEFEAASDSYDDEEMGSNIFQRAFEASEQSLDYAVMQERHEDIKGINSSILELNEIQRGTNVER